MLGLFAEYFVFLSLVLHGGICFNGGVASISRTFTHWNSFVS